MPGTPSLNLERKYVMANIPVKKVFDYVCELPVYTELDYDYQANFFENEFKNLHGGCSCVAKSVNGETVIARNLDFNISNKSAYIIRTNVPNFYKTVGVCYIPWFGPDFTDAVKNGIDEDYSKILPFFTCDILNEKGFYIEADMRNEEFIDGKPRYKNYGLNPGGPRVSAIAFLRYAAERCATIDDLLKLLEEIDFYSLSAPGIEWGFAYMVADKTGNFGVLEIAGDKVYFNKYQGAHTNSYVTPELASHQRFKAGLGRYYTLMANYFKAKDEQGMQDLIDLVRYSSQYEDPEACAFDFRFEYNEPSSDIGYEELIDPAMQEKLMQAVNEYTDHVNSMTREEKQNANSIWESTLSTRTNIMKGTMNIRFYEDNDRQIEIKVQ